MRSPIEILKNLSEKSQDKTYKFQRIYRNLYNPEFYYTAYRNIYANGGSMTPGVDGTTMCGLSERRIQWIIQKLQDQSYQPKPAKRTYIEKENSKKKRPLGIQTNGDKLVQEVVRMLLESIYEPTFSQNSHGFRQHRSCHTALSQLHATFTGTKWFVEGDITACFDSFDHHILTNLLRKRIDDEKFISLMWKFLKAGYIDQWEYHETYSGTAQGSGISPILANIYLHELDEYIEEYQIRYRTIKAEGNGNSNEYSRLQANVMRFKRKNAKIWETLTTEEKLERAKKLRKLQAIQRSVPSKQQWDGANKALHYIRYADDFIIGLIGSRNDAERVKADIGEFLREKLHLTLSETKTKITHSAERARFLGYDIKVIHGNQTKRTKAGMRRVYNGTVHLLAPHDKWAGKLLEYKAIRIKLDDKGKDHWRATHRSEFINFPDIDILRRYNAEVRGLYNYYRIADNATVVWKFAELMKHSMLKTLASKYRTKVKKIRERYVKDRIFAIEYSTRTGMKKSEFIHDFSQKDNLLFDDLDSLPAYKRYERRNSLRRRIKARTCELCGKTDCDIVMHQVKRLRDLKGSNNWERAMLNINRKTLAVCQVCYDKIHPAPKNDR